MLIDIWYVGVVLEFHNAIPCDTAIIARSGKTSIMLTDVRSAVKYEISRADAEARKNKGEIKFLAETKSLGELTFVELKESEQLEAIKRYAFIKSLEEKGIYKGTKLAIDAIEQIANSRGEKAPHWQSIRNWLKLYNSNGKSLRALYPHHRLKGCGVSRLDPRVVDFIESAKKRYYSSSAPTMSSAHKNVSDDIVAHNLENPSDPLKTPTYKTVQRRVLAVPYKFSEEKRRGKSSMVAQLATDDSGLEIDRILERVEVDHTPLDIYVLYGEHLTEIARPYMTALIDYYSRMLLGYQVSFEKPSFAANCIAWRNAFLSKDEFLQELECEFTWPAHGYPEAIVQDNGGEFWSGNIQNVAAELGFAYQYCPTGHPHYKGMVESFFNILSISMEDLPGYIKKPGKAAHGYDPVKEAKLTIVDLQKYIANYITGVYHNTPHYETAMTPNELWGESEKTFPVVSVSKEKTELALMATDERTLTGKGIKFENLFYNSDGMQALFMCVGKVKVAIKYNPFDLGYMLVLDPNSNIFIRVQCTKYEYAKGLSLYEHKVATGEVAKTKKAKNASPTLQKARAKLKKDRDEFHERNVKRKNPKSSGKDARITQAGLENQVGADGPELAVDNTKDSPVGDLHTGGSLGVVSDLDFDGWSSE